MVLDFTGRSGTLLGPLTTTWTMPDSCTVHVRNCATCDTGFRGQQCVSGQPEDHTTCWPPALKADEPPRHPFVGWGFYSPGLVCPSGYTTACTAEYGGRPEWEIEFTLIPDETAVGCCPEGFKCTNMNGNTCIATRTELAVATGLCSGSQVAYVAQTTLPAFVDIPITVSDDESNEIAVQTSTRQVVLLAPMFQLNFRSSDLVSSTTPVSSTQDSSTSTETSPASSETPLPTSSGPGDQSSGGSGLSAGATAGIAVGAALGGVLLGVLAIVLFIRSRRKKEEPGAPHHGDSAPPPAYPTYGTYKHATELSSAGREHSELPETSWDDRYELPVHHSPAPGPGQYDGINEQQALHPQYQQHQHQHQHQQHPQPAWFGHPSAPSELAGSGK
ncbi:hypothetical protein VTH06DRAFT_6767 [Thermothelomyces fergusii]